MRIFLVSDDSKGKLLKYSEQYQLFRNEKTALKHAKSIGYKDEFGMGINPITGMLNFYASGDIRVSIISLELNEL